MSRPSADCDDCGMYAADCCCINGPTERRVSVAGNTNSIGLSNPLDLTEHYAQRGRVLQELGALRDFARLRNRREWQWRRLWFTTTTYPRPRIKHLHYLLRNRLSTHEFDFFTYVGEKIRFIRDRRYAWQR